MDNINEITEEIRGSTDEQLKNTIEKWYEKIRTQSMKLGAKFISAAIFGVFQKHLKKKSKPSLRDYQRAMDEIIKIISVQLAEQNDLEEVVEGNTVVEEASND